MHSVDVLLCLSRLLPMLLIDCLKAAYVPVTLFFLRRVLVPCTCSAYHPWNGYPEVLTSLSVNK